MTGANPVSIEDLQVRLDGRTVLEEVFLEVEEGDFLGLIGPNGGGKTTLLKAILGLIKPSRGRVLVFGMNVFGMNPEAARTRVGYLPQKSLFDQKFPVSSVEVVMMGRYGRKGLFGRYCAEDKDAALAALAAVGMEEHADREIGALSGGQQQRIFVARALVSEPDLLLLDECWMSPPPGSTAQGSGSSTSSLEI